MKLNDLIKISVIETAKCETQIKHHIQSESEDEILKYWKVLRDYNQSINEVLTKIKQSWLTEDQAEDDQSKEKAEEEKEKNVM